MTNMTRPEFYDESGEYKQVVGKDSVGTLENLKEINTESINSDTANIKTANIDNIGTTNIETANIKTANISDSFNVNNNFEIDQRGVVTAHNIKANSFSGDSITIGAQFWSSVVDGKQSSMIGTMEHGIIVPQEGRINIPDYTLYRHVITLTNVQGGNCIDGTLFFTVYSDRDTEYTNLHYLVFTPFDVLDTVGFPCTGGGRNAQADTYYYFSYLHIDATTDDLVVTVQSRMSNNSSATLTLTQYSIKDEVVRIL